MNCMTDGQAKYDGRDIFKYYFLFLYLSKFYYQKCEYYNHFKEVVVYWHIKVQEIPI